MNDEIHCLFSENSSVNIWTNSILRENLSSISKTLPNK